MTTPDPYSAERVRAWAAQQYPSGTPLDQDRRMVAAETEAYLSGRTGRETSELSLAAKHAGPVDPPEQEPSDAEQAVRDLHHERKWRPLDGTFIGGTVCNACRRPYPCPTISVLDRDRAARRDEEKRDG